MPYRSALALAVLLVTAPASAQEIRVAAASDLQALLPGVVSRFEKETGTRVQTTFGSSGNFFAQIRNGAPFDVFLSADIEYPRRLQAETLGEPVIEYAEGRLVVWTRRDSGIDITSGLSALADPRVRRVAIANAEVAPYGRAAVAALKTAGLYDRIQSKIVMGENISQAAQFAQSGNAEAGILALSLTGGASLKGSGTFVEVPASLHPPIEQGAIVLHRARNKDAARRFVAFVRRALN